MADETGIRWGKIRSNIDMLMLAVTVVLFILGLVAIYSASGQEGLSVQNYAVRQFVWGCVSAVVYVLILKIGYKKILDFATPLFIATIVIFALLLIVGHTSKGAQSWFSLGFIRLQPSEMGKIVLALTLAKVCAHIPPIDFKGICAAIGISGLMIALILMQPDLGSSLVYSVMLFAVLVAAGSPKKFIAGIIGSAAGMLPIVWMLLKPYQKMRIMVFLDPMIDPQGAGYNVIQSRIAVGSGGIFGKGFLHGTQGILHFLPEPHTDFIFSVFSEEFGFIGCAAVLLLFGILLWKIMGAAIYTKDTRAKFMTVAIAAWIWFQMTESVAMSIGLLPVTGLTLPLFSYGGSSLLAVTMGLALVQSVVIVAKDERY